MADLSIISIYPAFGKRVNLYKYNLKIYCLVASLHNLLLFWFQELPNGMFHLSKGAVGTMVTILPEGHHLW